MRNIPRSHSMLLLIAIVISISLSTPLSFAQRKQRTNSNAPSKPNLTAQEVARKTLPAVVLVLCNDGKRSTLASGFFVQPGVLVTNFHVIEDMTGGLVRVAIGSKKERRTFKVTRVLGFDEESDLALLNIPDAKEAGIPALTLSPNGRLPEVGETIYALGNPEGLVGTISTGIVSAGLRSSEKRARLQITAPISHGSSGGPIVNARGDVVGVAVGSLSEGQNLNFAVPSSLIHLLLQSTKMPDDIADYLDNIRVKDRWLWPKSSASGATPTSEPAAPVSIIGPLRPGENKDRASLRKLAGVLVVIEELDPDALKLFGKQQLQTDVELRLRRNGIRLLTKDEWAKAPGSPYLYLHLMVLQDKTTGLYSYAYRLSLNQEVALERDRTFILLATTWEKESMGYAGSRVASSAIREAIGDVVDQFCNDYLAAN